MGRNGKKNFSNDQTFINKCYLHSSSCYCRNDLIFGIIIFLYGMLKTRDGFRSSLTTFKCIAVSHLKIKATILYLKGLKEYKTYGES